MSVPELVNALCHHLSALNDQPNTNFASTNKAVRDTLYKRYRDIAFSELLGLGTAAARRRGAGWGAENNAENNAQSAEGEPVRSKPGRRTSRVLDGLRERLLVGDGRKRSGRSSVIVAETGGGFVFSCTEGEGVYRFLELLATTWPEDVEEEELRARRDAWEAHVGRGILVDEPPSAAFLPGLVALRDVMDGASAIDEIGSGGCFGHDHRRIVPEMRGWFETFGGKQANQSPGPSPRRKADVGEDQTPTTTPRTVYMAEARPFAYQPSRSPVKVPIGSLFMDSSPGKMTAFDAGYSSSGEESARKLLHQHGTDHSQARQDALSRLEATKCDRPCESTLFGMGTLSIVNRDSLVSPRIIKEAMTLWNGEESEIAREALLALGGVRSSLSKLRGRLMMPQALPRPASAHILFSMVEAATARYLVEDFVMPVLKERDVERAKDPVSNAFAHELKHILEDVDRELVKVEMEEVNSWMQPVGLKMKAGLDAWGAEYHGMGMSILQLAHATAKSRASLLFLASYFDDGRGATEDGHDRAFHGSASEADARQTYCWFPRGKDLLEFLYSSAQYCAEGEQAGISKSLFLRSLAPYLVLVSRWAFGTEQMTSKDPFLAPLSSEFSMVALGDTLGPASFPSFFSPEMQRDLMVAGTQLRLLSQWQRSDNSEDLEAGTEIPSLFSGLNRMKDDVACSRGEENGAGGGDPLPAGQKLHAPSRWFTTGPSPGDLELRDAYAISMNSNSLKEDSDVPSWLSPATPPAERLVGLSTRRALFEHVLETEANHASISVLLDSYIGGVLRKQALLVSRTCVRLFVDHQQLNTLSVIRFLRNALMGVAGDFSSELVRSLDASILGLEPMTALKARAAVYAASSNSCLHDSPFVEHLTAGLLPEGENAVSIVEDAFSYSTDYSDVIRMKTPYMSSMAPMLVPPTGQAAYDCIHVSFVAPGLLAAIISEDTMTAYSAIFSMNVRLRRALLALETMSRATTMGRHEKMKCTRGDFELPWAERFKTFRAFCLSCHVHLDAIAQMYLACCSGADWNLVERSFSSEAGELDMDHCFEAADVHTLIKIHKRYVYGAASKITSACDSPAIKLGIESMIDAVLELRDTVEQAGRRHDRRLDGRHSVQHVFDDLTHWQEIKRLMLAYERGRLGALRLMNQSWRPLNEKEKFRFDFLSALDT